MTCNINISLREAFSLGINLEDNSRQLILPKIQIYVILSFFFGTLSRVEMKSSYLRSSAKGVEGLRHGMSHLSAM